MMVWRRRQSRAEARSSHRLRHLIGSCVPAVFGENGLTAAIDSVPGVFVVLERHKCKSWRPAFMV